MAAPSTRQSIIPRLTLVAEDVLPIGGAVAGGFTPTAGNIVPIGGAVATGRAVAAATTLEIQGAFARGRAPVVIIPVSATLTVEDTYSVDDVLV